MLNYDCFDEIDPWITVLEEYHSPQWIFCRNISGDRISEDVFFVEQHFNSIAFIFDGCSRYLIAAASFRTNEPLIKTS